MQQYQIRTARAGDLAEFFSAPESDLTANGLSMAADGDLLIFDQAVVDFLVAHRTSDDDGYIAAGDDFGLALWVQGEEHVIETVRR